MIDADNYAKYQKYDRNNNVLFDLIVLIKIVYNSISK